MNKRVKELWIKALRSGKFKQGGGRLRKQDRDGDVRHCCLGVLEELACTAGVIENFEGHFGSLDREVMLWAGLDSDDPALGTRKFKNNQTPYAAWLNDNGYTFKQIADRIEKYL